MIRKINDMPAIGCQVRGLLFAIIATVAVPAGADESSPWQMGIQLGTARGSRDLPVLSSEGMSTANYDVTTTVGDKNRLGWRVFTGYRLTNYLGLQLGYTDLGEAQRQLQREASPLTLVRDTTGLSPQSARGLDFGVQLKVPVAERLALSVRGGGFRWKSQSSEQDSDTFFGAGAEVSIFDNLNGTLEWVRYEVAGEPIALWTLGVLYRMGD